MSLLANVDMFYLEAEPYIRKKLLGSMFTEKLVFEDGKYRTNGVNPAVELIGLFQNGLRNKKTERLHISEKTFGDVPFTELTSNRFLEGMKKIFELEPFINVEQHQERYKFEPEIKAMMIGG